MRFGPLLLSLPIFGCAVPSSHPACPQGQLDVDDRCVPAACGEGPWGSDGEGADLFVSPNGDDDGRGTKERPFASIRAALDAAAEAEGGRIAIAEGRYEEPLELSSDHDGVVLAGRCSALVVVESGDEDNGLDIHGALDAEVSGLTLSGSLNGVYIYSDGASQDPRVVLNDLVVDGVLQNAVTVEGDGAELVATGLRVSGGGGGGAGASTAAVGVWDGASVEISGLRVERFAGIGLLVYGGQAESRAVVRDAQLTTFVDPMDGATLAGLVAEAPADLDVEGLWLDGAQQFGVLSSGSGAVVRLSDALILNTSAATNQDGFGIYAQGGGNVVAEHLVVDAASTTGIAAYGSGILLDLRDIEVRNTRLAVDGSAGEGLALFDGPELVGDDIRIFDNWNVGFALSGTGTRAEVRGLAVSGTVHDPGFPASRGVEVGAGAVAVFQDVAITDNEHAGIVAMEAGTSVTIERGIVAHQRVFPGAQGGAAGIAAQDGATLTVLGVTVEDNPMVNLVIHGSSATLEDLILRAPLPTETEGALLGRGLGVQGGSVVHARRVVIDRSVDVGLFVEGSEIDLEDVTIRRGRAFPGDLTGGRGATFVGGSWVDARRLVVEDNQEVGILVGGAGTSVQIEDSRIDGTLLDQAGGFGTGLHVQEAAWVTAIQTTLEGNHTVSVVSGHAGTWVDLIDCRVEGTGTGVDGAFGRGAEVAEGGTLVSTDTEWVENREVGVVVRDPGSFVSFTRGAIRRTRDSVELMGGMGVAVENDAEMEAEGLIIEDGQGPGLFLTLGGSARCVDCEFVGNAFGGVSVLDGDLELVGGRIQGSPRHVEYGGGVGLFAWGHWAPPRVRVEGTVFTDLEGPAIYLREPGRYAILDVTLDAVATAARAPAAIVALDGIAAWGGGDGLLIEGVTFGDLTTDGVLLHRAGAELRDLSFGEVIGFQVHRQSCDGASELVVDASVTSTDDCVGPPREIVPRLLMEFETLDFVIVQ